MDKNLPNRLLDNAEQDLLKLMADSHISSSIDTPMREDAFDLDDDTKIQLIEKHFSHIMNILGLDLSDDSLRDTPKRVAKMYVKEITPVWKVEVSILTGTFIFILIKLICNSNPFFTKRCVVELFQAYLLRGTSSKSSTYNDLSFIIVSYISVLIQKTLLHK